jgi:crossover junction endodeoxyribonuclease RuvC
MRILGIDPGSSATGYGLVDYSAGKLAHVAHGVIRPAKSAQPAARLAHIHREILQVVDEFAPEACAIEQVFVAANARSALILGQARGVALAALGTAALPVSELSAREVKKALVGTGTASKAQMQAMVKRLLELPALPQSDAADALAVAICQAHAGKLASLGVRNSRGRRRRPRVRSELAPRTAR